MLNKFRHNIMTLLFPAYMKKKTANEQEDPAVTAYKKTWGEFLAKQLDQEQKDFLNQWYDAKFSDAKTATLYDKYECWEFAEAVNFIADNKLNVEFNQREGRHPSFKTSRVPRLTAA